MASEDPKTVDPVDEKKAIVEDAEFYEEEGENLGDATWGEVIQTCCVHSGEEWAYVFLGIFGIVFFLYFFLLGLNLLGTSAKVISGCAAGSLLGDDTNPVAGLMIGILATVLMQSSSTTTSIVVSLVSADAVGVKSAIYMIMGANIGTSVTNTIVAMGQMGDGDQLERAFAGATVHDMFNFLTVALLFPFEVITHFLYALTKAMLPDDVADGEKWEGPIKKVVSPLGKKIININKSVTKSIATGKKDSCDDFYPTTCDGGVETYDTCGKVGLIACDKKSGDCPAFFQDGATRNEDEVSGYVCLVLSLFLLVTCLIGLVTILQKMLLGTSTRIIYKSTNINGYLAIVIGTGLTILVQSSSITTSTLTPLVGMGVLPLDKMLPLTLGANIGTTFTALMSAMVSDSIDSLQVALCHLFFNITGIIIWYPLPFMRAVPLHAAAQLGKATRIWRGFPLVYIAVMFLLIPLMFFGLSKLYEQGTVGFTVLGVFITLLIGLMVIFTAVWWRLRDGKTKVVIAMETREKKRTALASLPDDMQYLKKELERLKEHTGLPEDLEEGEDADEE